MPFLPGTFLEPAVIPTTQAAVLSVLCVMYPSTAVFYSECIECFPGMTFKIFSKPFVTIPVAPIMIEIITHLLFHIHYVSIHKLL